MAKSKGGNNHGKFRIPEFVLIILLIFGGLSLGFSSGRFVVNFREVGFTAISTMEMGVHIVCKGVTDFFNSISERTRLQKEYVILQEKLANYEYLQRNNADIRKENERLREQLEFAKQAENKNIAAQIVGRDPDSLYSALTIDKGAANGIKKGMPVMAIQHGNIGLVGKVVSVGKLTSKVMPIYDVNCNISARIQNTRDIGIVAGNGSYDNALSMKYIRKRVLEDFNIGDIVVTSGENGNYMSDIPIGRISKIAILDYDSSLDIELDPVIDFARLDIVLVIDTENENDRDDDEEIEEAPVLVEGRESEVSDSTKDDVTETDSSSGSIANGEAEVR